MERGSNRSSSTYWSVLLAWISPRTWLWSSVPVAVKTRFWRSLVGTMKMESWFYIGRKTISTGSEVSGITFLSKKVEGELRIWFWPSMTTNSPRFRGMSKGFRLSRKNSRERSLMSSITSGGLTRNLPILSIRFWRLVMGRRILMCLRRGSNNF